MIDIHSHLLYGIDDGASKIEDSLRMISEAEKLGIKGIITTIHHHCNLYDNENDNEKFLELSDKAVDFGVALGMGYEVFINSVHKPDMKKAHTLTLNNTNYMLIEFPFSEFSNSNFETIYSLLNNNIIPIIAHPERTRSFIENQDVLMSFLECGCLLQVDVASVLGVYGRHARNLVKKLVCQNKIHFVASNAHFSNDYTEWYSNAYKTISRWAGSEYAGNVFFKNAQLILDENKVLQVL